MSPAELIADYVDRASLAEALKVSPRTISRYENQPDGLPSLLIGGRKHYRMESVRKWLDRREQHPNRRRRAG
jgi:phage terminase Nu1 subunit (DNA packaging protein)